MDLSASDPLRNGAIFKLLAHRGGSSVAPPGAAPPSNTRSPANGSSSSGTFSLSNLSANSGHKHSSSDLGTSPPPAVLSSSLAPHGFDPVYMARVKSRFNELYRATPIPASILYSDAKTALSSAVGLSPSGLVRALAAPTSSSSADPAASPGFVAPVGSPSVSLSASVLHSPQANHAPYVSVSKVAEHVAPTDAVTAVGNSESEGSNRPDVHASGVGGFQIPLKIISSPESTLRGLMNERGLSSEATLPVAHVGSRSTPQRSPIASPVSTARRIQPVLLSPSPHVSPVSRHSPPPAPPSIKGRVSDASDDRFVRDGQNRHISRDLALGKTVTGPFNAETSGLVNTSERPRHSRKRSIMAVDDEPPVADRIDDKRIIYIRTPHSNHSNRSTRISDDIQRPRRGKSKIPFDASENPPGDARPPDRHSGLGTGAIIAIDDTRATPNTSSRPMLNNRRSRAQVNSLLSLMAPAGTDLTNSSTPEKLGEETKTENVLSKASPMEVAAVVQRSRGRPRKNAPSSPLQNTAVTAEYSHLIIPSAARSNATKISGAKSIHGLLSSEVWSQEEIRVLRKIHLSVPLELHDFWREVSSRYNRWMSDTYGSEVPLRSARECQDVWFEMLSKPSHPRPHRAAVSAKSGEARGAADPPRKRMTQARMKEIATLASVSRPDDLFDVLAEGDSNDGTSILSRYGSVSNRFRGGEVDDDAARSSPVARQRRRDSIRTPQQTASATESSSGDDAYPVGNNGTQEEVDRYIYKPKLSVDIDSRGADWAPSYARNLAKKSRVPVETNSKAPKKKIKRLPTALVSEESFRTETDLAIEKALRQRGGNQGSSDASVIVLPRGRVRAEVDLSSGRVRTVVDDEEDEEGDEGGNRGFVDSQTSDVSLESELSDY